MIIKFKTDITILIIKSKAYLTKPLAESATIEEAPKFSTYTTTKQIPNTKSTIKIPLKFKNVIFLNI